MSEHTTGTSFPMAMDHLVILASDLPRSLNFYATLLPMIGFKRINDHLFANEQGLHFDFRAATEPEHGYHRYGPGLNHLGFTAASLEQIETVRAQMAERGFSMPEIQNIEGDRALFIKDPDGLRVELTYYPPRHSAS